MDNINGLLYFWWNICSINAVKNCGLCINYWSSDNIFYKESYSVRKVAAVREKIYLKTI